MRVNTRHLFIRLVLFALTAAAAFVLIFLRYDPPLEIKSMNETLEVPQGELDKLDAAAKAGDPQAALRLSYQYGLFLNDTRKMFYYTWLASETGDAHSIREWNTLKSSDPRLAQEIEDEFENNDSDSRATDKKRTSRKP